MKLTIQSKSLEGTFAIGEALIAALPDGWCVALQGQLGGGKTHLVKGMARGIGVENWRGVKSPTFTLLQSFNNSERTRTLHHMDLYRLADAGEVPQEMIEALEDRAAISAVEWAELMPDILPAQTLVVDCEVIDEDARRYTLSCEDAELMEKLSGLLAE